MKNNLFRKLGIYGEETPDNVEEEIISMVNEGHEHGVLHETEAEMITNIFEFGDKEAKDIMTNRSNILAIDREMTLSEALDYMLSENKSRFPVYHENIDHIEGILHFRDAVRSHNIPGNLEKPVGEIEGLVREAMFVPETKNIADLFRTMQKTKTQMVIVVDEYGQTLGLIAMEDILEEIVGNILDEHDEEEVLITKNADGSYTANGMMDLEDLEDVIFVKFEKEEYETLNGFLIDQLDRIPGEDEQCVVEYEGYRFTVLFVDNNTIQRVKIEKRSEE